MTDDRWTRFGGNPDLRPPTTTPLHPPTTSTVDREEAAPVPPVKKRPAGPPEDFTTCHLRDTMTADELEAFAEQIVRWTIG